MGAWAEGPFDNDDAADYVGGLMQMATAEATQEIDRALALQFESGFIDGFRMSQSIAAAAIIALIAGAAGSRADEAPSAEWLETARPMLTMDRSDQAAGLFVRAFDPTDNELFELWDEGDAVNDARQACGPYIEALQRAQ